MTQPDPTFLDVDQRRIATLRRQGEAPAVLFLPGYASDMTGEKATAIDSFAGRRGLSSLRLDYSGTGASGGDFAEGRLDHWIDEALAVLDSAPAGPVVVVGSSLGGWIALHLALRRPERVAALVGIAPAPDFTQWGFSESQKQVIVREGLLEEENPHGGEPSRFYRGFWESGQELRLLEEPIAIDCPIRLVHGEEDPNVPLEISTRLMRQLRSGDVQLLTIKGGQHRLSEPHEIAAILMVLAGVLENLH